MDNKEKDINAVLGRGVGRIEVLGDLKKKMRARKLVVKFGIDPTSPDIHLGHLVALRKLKQLQDLGHKIIFLIGDFTAKIGDPSDKMSPRRPLTKQEIKKNMKSYEKQVAVILDMKKVEIRYNSEWLEDLGFKEMFVLMHFFTAKQILERDMFQRRIEKEKPIWLHEFIYPILQAYDSVALRADLEVGGSDQEFNLLAARQIQPHYKQAPQNILTVPLLIGVDGKEKMSQSLGNYVGLAEKPNEQFGKLMSIPDGLIKHYYELLTDVSEEELGDIARRLKEKKENPRDIKLGLAHVIVAQLNGTRAADMAREEFLNVFSKRESPKDIPVCKIKPGTPLREALHKAGVTASRSQADRLIMQGAIRVGEKRILEKDYVFTGDEPTVVKAGKHKFVKFTFSEK